LEAQTVSVESRIPETLEGSDPLVTKARSLSVFFGEIAKAQVPQEGHFLQPILLERNCFQKRWSYEADLTSHAAEAFLKARLLCVDGLLEQRHIWHRFQV